MIIAGRKRPLVYIEWEDSFGVSANWEVIKKEAKATPMICASVGWLVQDDRKVKVVVPHLTHVNRDGNKSGCGDMTIPASAVVKMVRLKVPNRK